MEFRILGPVEVWDGAQLLDLGGPKPRALLAVLLVYANQVVSTDRLVDQLWDHAPPPTARNLTQVYVSRLRQTLQCRRTATVPGQVLVTRPPGYLLRVEAGELDVHRFEALAAAARRATAAGDLAGAAERWRAALALWRGPALDGVASEALRRSAAPRLEEVHLGALEERLEVDLRLGRHAELVGELETLANEHPLRERLRRQLMLALYRSGRPAEALAVYHTHHTASANRGAGPGAQPGHAAAGAGGPAGRSGPGADSPYRGRRSGPSGDAASALPAPPPTSTTSPAGRPPQPRCSSCWRQSRRPRS
jgi:DNA-binding SARP family transcriptional activator